MEVLRNLNSGSSSHHIEDIKHPLLRRVSDIMRSTSSKPRMLIIDDEENILQAMASGVEIESIFVSQSFKSELDEHLLDFNELYTVKSEAMKPLFKGDKRARVFALARSPKPQSLQNMIDIEGDLLVLDGVRIAGNIGAIIRSARAFDSSGVVLLNSGLTNVYDRRIIRASRGLIFSLPVMLADAMEVLSFLNTENIPLASLAADGDTELSAIDESHGKIALLMGSERVGASNQLESLSTWRCSLPMNQNVESLNVSVAAGIALYERKRRGIRK